MAGQDGGTREAPLRERSPAGWLRKRIGSQPARPQRRPWRVEGADESDPGQPGRDAPTGGSGRFRFW
jgi:hypothetical protein